MFLLITHDQAHQPMFSKHSTGALNETDRRRKVALIGIPERFRGLTIDELRLVMQADIDAAILTGINEGLLVAEAAPRPKTE